MSATNTKERQLNSLKSRKAFLIDEIEKKKDELARVNKQIEDKEGQLIKSYLDNNNISLDQIKQIFGIKDEVVEDKDAESGVVDEERKD